MLKGFKAIEKSTYSPVLEGPSYCLYVKDSFMAQLRFGLNHEFKREIPEGIEN